MTLMFLFDVGEVAGFSNRNGIIVQTEMMDRYPDQVGRHPNGRVAYTYEATVAYCEQCRADDLAHQRKMDAWKQFQDADGQAWLAAGEEAAAKVRAAMLRKHPRQMAYSGGGGDKGGQSMGRSPDVESQIREAVSDARAEGRAAYRERHPVIDLATFEKKIYKP